MTDHPLHAGGCGRRFGELDDHARERALAMVEQQLTDHGWDSADSSELTDAITLALAETLGAAARGGIPEVEVIAWSPYRGRHLTIAGMLHRGNSPTLPWARHIRSVTLTGCGRVAVHPEAVADPAAVGCIAQAVQAAIATAWQVAHRQLLRRHALEWIAGVQPTFDPAGTLLLAAGSALVAATPAPGHHHATARQRATAARVHIAG